MTPLYRRVREIRVKPNTQCRIHLEFDVRLTADRNVAANVGIVTMLLQKLNVTNEDLAQPLENLGVVEDLVLDQLLRD